MTELIIFNYAYIVLQMSVIWLLYRTLKNPSVVDVSWPFGLMMTGLIYIWHQPINLRLIVLSCLLVLWALRLGGYLWYTRVRKGHVDKRYLQLSNNWKIAKSLGFFLNFQLQGIFILIMSIIFLFSAVDSPKGMSFLDYSGTVLVIIGVIGESIADLQLYHFRNNQKGKVCNAGLWNYSRHPNYFFELLVWCGFTLFALHHRYGWVGFISPSWLYIIFTKMTIPITERGSIESKRQAYIDYQKKTSMIFPWLKKTSNSP
jgi:steroid 5-alpha reductase family enzyme